MTAPRLITDNLDLWTAAVTPKANNGRGSNGQPELTGIKKLRELILELAVRGKLVPQNPADEPASVLLKKIAAEKARLVKEGKIKKPKPLPAVGEGEQPFVLPEGWALTNLENIGYWAVGNGFPIKEQGLSNHDVLFCKVSDMNLPGNHREIVRTTNTVSEETAKRLRLHIHPPGTVIFPKIGGAIATNKRRLIVRLTAIDNNCLGITPSCGITSEYLLLFLTTIDMQWYQDGTSVPALGQGTLGKIPVHLPPLAEQHRIVEKVDELMALCEQLKKHLHEANQVRQHLAGTVAASNLA